MAVCSRQTGSKLIIQRTHQTHRACPKPKLQGGNSHFDLICGHEMPSAVFLFIYFEVKHTAKALMRFKIENKEHTLRQIQHNEFLIRISKDPLKLKLRAFQSECCLSWNQ